MQVLRHYFISDDMDDLEHFEEQLEAEGVDTPRVHVLTLDDTDADNHHHLHSVTSLMKKDVIHSGEIGAAIGAVGAVVVLLATWLLDWHLSPAGWIPWIFLAVIVFGFCTWEGGFIGIQRPNHHFKRFNQALSEGKHVFFVDLDPDQEGVLEKIVKRHGRAEIAGVEKGTPHWVLAGAKRIPHLLTETLP